MRAFDQPYWTLSRAIAWIYTRDAAILDEITKTTSDAIAIELWAAELGTALFSTADDAEDELLAQVQRRKLAAWAREDGHGEMKRLTDGQTINLRVLEEQIHGDRQMHLGPDHSAAGDTHWYAVHFERDDMLRLWPPIDRTTILADLLLRQDDAEPSEQETRLLPPEPPHANDVASPDDEHLPDTNTGSEPARPPKQSQRQNCKGWIVSMMAAGPPTMTRPEFEKAAKQRFGMSRDDCRELERESREELGITQWFPRGTRSHKGATK